MITLLFLKLKQARFYFRIQTSFNFCNERQTNKGNLAISRKQLKNSLFWKSCPNNSCAQRLHLQVEWEQAESTVCGEAALVFRQPQRDSAFFYLQRQSFQARLALKLNAEPLFLSKREENCVPISPAAMQDYRLTTMVELLKHEYGGCSLPWWPDGHLRRTYSFTACFIRRDLKKPSRPLLLNLHRCSCGRSLIPRNKQALWKRHTCLRTPRKAEENPDLIFQVKLV